MKPNMGFVLLMLRVSPCTKLKHESKSTSMIFLRLIRKQGIDSLKGSKACGLLYMAGWIVYDACRLMNKMKCSTWYSQKIYERRDTHTCIYMCVYTHTHTHIYIYIYIYLFIHTYIDIVTCILIKRSALCFLWNRFFLNSSRILSTSARSSGVPASGSNSQCCRPMKLFRLTSSGPPSAIFNFHIL